MKFSTVSVFKTLHFSNENYIKLEGDLLRKYQISLLTIMEDIISLCESEGFYYSLSGGSALGAIRHKGFIPWDDDMDIFMLGSERKSFLNKFHEKFKDKYWIHSADTDNYGLTIGRVRKKGTVFRGREDLENDEVGFFVDIFWVESVPDSFILRNLQGFLSLSFGFILSCRNFYKNRDFMLQIANEHKSVRTSFIIKIIIGFIVSFISVKDLAMMTQKIYSFYKNENSKYVSIPSGRKHYFGELFLREDIVCTKKVQFENYQMNVPFNIEKYLETMYGNYLEIPPVHKRESHIVLEIQFED